MSRQKHRVVVVAGGDWSKRDAMHIDPDTDWIVAADGGAQSLIDHGLWPDLLVGDMDTLSSNTLKACQKHGSSIRKLPERKNMTDTHYACELALSYQPKQVMLMGAWGGSRMDHALANLGLLEWFREHGVHATMIAGSNRTRLLCGPTSITLVKTGYLYISLLPVSEQVTGIYTKGLKYPLQDGTLIRGFTLGISNELNHEEGVVELQRGKLLLIESSDWLF